MSLTAIIWVVLWFVLALATLIRPAFGAPLYMHSFFANPAYWWWGKQTALGAQRWNLYASIIFLVAAAIHGKLWRRLSDEGKWTDRAALGMVLNAVLVHLLLAPNQTISYHVLDPLIKCVVLYFILSRTLCLRQEIQWLILAIALGGGFIGEEVKFNHAGKFQAGRLERVGPPGADASNTLACLMVATLPCVGYLALATEGWKKWVAIACAPFTLNVILLCNSRGGLLGALASGMFLLVASRGRVRKKVLRALAVAAFAVFLLLGDTRIIDRFMTTFASEENRDNSAASRLVYWGAALRIIKDHPLGSGGDGFKRIYGPVYLRDVGVYYEARSVHNGYLNDACDWGLQGIFLRVAFLLSGMWSAFKTMKYQDALGNSENGFLGSCIVAGIAAFSVHSVFGSYIDSEWGFWLAAMGTCYGRVLGPSGEQTDNREQEPSLEIPKTAPIAPVMVST